MAEPNIIEYINSFPDHYKIGGSILVIIIVLTLLWNLFKLGKMLYLKVKSDRRIQLGVFAFTAIVLLLIFREPLGLNQENVFKFYDWLVSLDWLFLSRVFAGVLGATFLILFFSNTWDLRTKILLFLIGETAVFSKSSYEKKIKAKLKKQHDEDINEVKAKLTKDFNEQLKHLQDNNEQLEKKLEKALSNKPPSPYDAIDEGMEKIQEIKNNPSFDNETKEDAIKMIRDSMENVANANDIAMTENRFG